MTMRGKIRSYILGSILLSGGALNAAPDPWAVDLGDAFFNLDIPAAHLSIDVAATGSAHARSYPKGICGFAVSTSESGDVENYADLATLKSILHVRRADGRAGEVEGILPKSFDEANRDLSYVVYDPTSPEVQAGYQVSLDLDAQASFKTFQDYVRYQAAHMPPPPTYIVKSIGCP